MRGLDINIYNINEYINLEIYLPNRNNINIILIKREFYIIDNLIAKVFIGTDILKPEEIIFDIARDVIIITSCKNLEILIISNNQRQQIKIIIFNIKNIIIPLYSNIAVLIIGPKSRKFNLLNDREFLFKLYKLNTLFVYSVLTS